ncbi:polysaccharide pyruvyl transferase family protein [Cereibacter changlensis]|uniref:Polysaccharide pyruvyl transferase family protein n=2 Tax=Cereibacter changlensis TaxID=402884 RepID=A0A4U0Z4L2_9RHOB|nr:polysaccharide pyruvyl transferase family protein [Cereibacter changlensis]
MENLRHCLNVRGLTPTFAFPFDRDWRESRRELPKVGSIDCIIVNGEGSMHSSRTRWRASALSQVGTLGSQTYRVPTFLINASFHGNEPDFYNDLRNFDAVFVRDTYSRDLAARFGVACRVVSDLTLSRNVTCLPSIRRGIGITDSVKPECDRMLRRIARESGSDFCAMTLPAVKAITIGRALNPVFWLRRNEDKRLAKQRLFEDVDSFIRWIASKELILTGRYHTVTLCLLTQTPFACVNSNTPKIRSLLYDWGVSEERIKSIDDLNRLSVEGGYPFSADEISSIGKCQQVTSVKTSEMFDLIAKAARDRPRQKSF